MICQRNAFARSLSPVHCKAQLARDQCYLLASPILVWLLVNEGKCLNLGNFCCQFTVLQDFLNLLQQYRCAISLP